MLFRSAAWRVTIASALCIAVFSYVVAVLLAPLTYAALILALDLVNFVVRMPNLATPVLDAMFSRSAFTSLMVHTAQSSNQFRIIAGQLDSPLLMCDRQIFRTTLPKCLRISGMSPIIVGAHFDRRSK